MIFISKVLYSVINLIIIMATRHDNHKSRLCCTEGCKQKMVPESKNERTYGLTQRLPFFFFLLLLLTFEELIAKGRHLHFTTMLPWSCTDVFKITSHTRKKVQDTICNTMTCVMITHICYKMSWKLVWRLAAVHNCFSNVYFLDPFSKLTYSSGYHNFMQIKAC